MGTRAWSSYVFNGELCYVAFAIDNKENCLFIDGKLNLPVLYKVGDIGITDWYPFDGTYKFVVVKVGDNRDCCIQGLSRNEDGQWDVGAVKHGSIGTTIGYPKISPLYSVVKYELDASAEEDLV